MQEEHLTSQDYTLTNPDFEVRESAISGTNRGIYSSGATTTDGNSAARSMLAIGVSPFKAYVKGYEVERIGTTFVDVNKQEILIHKIIIKQDLRLITL